MSITASASAEPSTKHPTPITSYGPVVFPVPGRPADLELKVTAPAEGSNLPVVLLSHGHGSSNFASSLYGYGPLANPYASDGFVVIQPTHLDSTTLGSDPTGPEGPLFWRARAEDMRFILDHLEEVESAVPGLAGRIDHDQIVVVGHSLGGHTGAMLLGMRLTDPNDGSVVDLSDKRVKGGVLMTPPGDGSDLAEFAAKHFPMLKQLDFTTMTAPALVVVGDRDLNPRFSPRLDYRSDAYRLSPGPKSLLTLFGAEHMLGGVSGYDQAETTDENPARVALVARLTTAYLRNVLDPSNQDWDQARQELVDSAEPSGTIVSK